MTGTIPSLHLVEDLNNRTSIAMNRMMAIQDCVFVAVAVAVAFAIAMTVTKDSTVIAILCAVSRLALKFDTEPSYPPCYLSLTQ